MKSMKLVFGCVFFISASIYSQSTLTPRLLFDFSPGDEFHYSSSSYYNTTYYGGFKMKILSRTNSLNNDTIYYGIRKDTWSQTSSQGSSSNQIDDTIFSTVYDTLIYTNLDSTIKHIPEYNSASFLTYLGIYDAYAEQDSFCLTTLSYSEDTTLWTFASNNFLSYFSSYSYYGNSCNGNSSTNNSNRFAIGLGKVSSDYSYCNNQSTGSSYQLVYYKKDSVSIGTPDALLSTAEVIPTADFIIYPNPVVDKMSVIISSDLLGKTFTIHDYLGSKISEGVFEQQNTSLNLINLHAGLYFLKVSEHPKCTKIFIKN